MSVIDVGTAGQSTLKDSESPEKSLRKREDFKILNIGCGSNHLEHAWNIDADPKVKPDQVVNVTIDLPFPPESFESVLMFHTIEHIPKKTHAYVLMEIRRVLRPEGSLFMSYPEFKHCAMNYLSNYKGKKEFWEATIFGRQTSVWDVHVALMDTDVFLDVLKRVGFKLVMRETEPEEEWNTVLQLEKGEPMKTYEDILKKELFDEWKRKR